MDWKSVLIFCGKAPQKPEGRVCTRPSMRTTFHSQRSVVELSPDNHRHERRCRLTPLLTHGNRNYASQRRRESIRFPVFGQSPVLVTPPIRAALRPPGKHRGRAKPGLSENITISAASSSVAARQTYALHHTQHTALLHLNDADTISGFWQSNSPQYWLQVYMGCHQHGDHCRRNFATASVRVRT